MKMIWFIFLLFFSNISLGNSSVEKLIISRNYSQVKSVLADKKNKNWKDYYYLGTSNYHLGFKNQAYLYGLKSLFLNPFSQNNIKNLSLFNNRESSVEVNKIANASVLKLSLGLLMIVMLFLSIAFLRKKRLVTFICIIEILIAGVYFVLSSRTIYGDLEYFSVQKKADHSSVLISPMKGAGNADGFSARDILFAGKMIGEWRYVENISGNAGWINDSNLVY